MVSILEQEFRAQLHQAGRIGTDDLAEGGTADVAVDGLRSEELGVIENVESFQPKLERLRFGQAHVLEQRHVVIVHPRSGEEAPRGVARRAQGVLAELGGIEIRPPVAGIVIQIERTAGVVGLIDAIIVDAIRFGSEQGIVPVVDESDRQP